MTNPSSHTRRSLLDTIFLRSYRPYAWFVLLVFLLYGHTLSFREYTHQDDYHLIVVSYPLISNPAHLKKAFLEEAFHERQQAGMIYRPMLTISFMIDAQLGGTDPFVYRLNNLLLHALVTILLFRLLLALRLQTATAFIISLVFAIHPALTYTVVWIPGRNDLLLAVFILSSLLTLIRFQREKAMRWLFLHVLMFALALFTKETALLFPPLYLGFLFLDREHRLPILAYLLLVVSWGFIITYWFILREGAMLAPLGSVSEAIVIMLNQSWMLLPYLGMVVWPWELFILSAPQDLPLLPGIVSALLLVVLVSVATRRNWPLLLIGLAWFAVFLLPTFFFHANVKVLKQVMEHRIYISAFGLILMLVSLHFGDGIRRWIPTLRLPALMFLIVLAVFSVRHTLIFENSLTYREAVARTSPNNYYNHNDPRWMLVSPSLSQSIAAADTMRSVLLPPESIHQHLQQLEQAFTAQPDNRELQNDFAAMLFAAGRLKSAEKELLALYTDNPLNPVTAYNLGVLYYHAHREDLAEHYWLRALELNPSLADAYRNLCYLYYKKNQFALARSYGEQASRLGAEVPTGLMNEIALREREQSN